MMKMTDQEYAIVLVALRNLQAEWSAELLKEYEEHFAGLSKPSASQIDSIIDRMQTASLIEFVH